MGSASGQIRNAAGEGGGGGGLLSVSGPIQEARGYDHVAVTRSCWESGSGDETRVHACGLVLYPDRL